MDDFFEDIPNEENKDTEHKTEPPVEPHTKNKKDIPLSRKH